MRWAWFRLFTLLLALAGCKSTDKDKPSIDRDAPAKQASRGKGKPGPTWLDNVKENLPGGGGGVPKADSWADATDADIATEVRGFLAGVVIDPDGRHAGSVTILIEPSVASNAPVPPAPMSIVSDPQGYFSTRGLKPGQSYTLTVRVMMEGRPLAAIQQARVPNPNLTLKLRDDINPQSMPTSETGPSSIPPGAVQGFVPPPPSVQPSTPGQVRTRSHRRRILPPSGSASRPQETDWAPGKATTAPLHKVVPPPTSNSNPNPTPMSRPAKPENQTIDPRPDWKPPAASIPTPALPALPPPITPLSPSSTDPSKSRASTGRPASLLALTDDMNRPWTFENRSGRIVLVDFMTTTCVPCKSSIKPLVTLQSRYAAYGLQVIAVACDEMPAAQRAAAAAKYSREMGMNYPVYTEPGAEPGSVRDRLHVDKYPTVVLFDQQGHEVWRGHPTRDFTSLEAAVRQQLSTR